MALDHGKYDSALLGILQNEGKVAPFIDVVLGFLYRRTDFFRLMKTETDRLGFPPGVALKLLVNIFKKYEALSEQDQKQTDLRKAQSSGKKDAGESVQPTKSTDSALQSANIDDRGQDAPSCERTPSSDTAQTSRVEAESCSQDRMPDIEVDKVAAEPSQLPPVSSTNNKAEQEADGEEQDDPEQARKRRELQSNPLTYNGAACEKYYWSQTITEADVRVKVPKSIVKGKQVKVDIGKKRISVSCQLGTSWSEMVSGELEWEVRPDDSMWTLSPGEFVHVNLEKKQERWWERVFVGEDGINTRKIDCSRPMTDLDDEAQAKIEEMMYNQRQKQLGLPQSHELKTHEMLRKAWDAEGSPFKGQPFDPSKFTVDPSGTATFTGGQ